MLTKNTLKKNPLLSIRELFKKSYQFYSENFKNLIFIMLIAFVPIAILDIITKIISASTIAMETNLMIILSALLILLLFLGILALSISNQIALIYFIDKKTSIKESCTATKKYFLSYLFISILLLIIVKGSSILLSTFSTSISDFLIKNISSKGLVIVLLTIIFLAILVILFYIVTKLLFSFIILIVENLKGIEALKKSRTIIGDYWQEVSIRFATFIILFAVINRIFTYIASMIPSFPFSYYIAYFISALPFIFLIPFALIFVYTLYKNLREIS